MLEPDQWNEVLGRLVGTVYRGIERIASATIMNALGVPSDKEARQREGKRIVSPRLGWNGPKNMRIDATVCRHGYWRIPNAPPKAFDPVANDLQLDLGEAESLPQALEQVTRLSIKELRRILRLPLDDANGNLLRSKVTAAGIALNAQLRADEQRLKAKATGDVLERLIKIIDEERRLLPKDRPQLEAAAAVDGDIEAAARKGV
jgi:hypothetical protein